MGSSDKAASMLWRSVLLESARQGLKIGASTELVNTWSWNFGAKQQRMRVQTIQMNHSSRGSLLATSF